MRKYNVNIGIFGLMIGLSFSCSTSQSGSIKTLIKQPFEGIDVAKEIFKINPTEKSSIITKEGTVIKIPANILVDKEGRKMKEIVSISYRSINTPGEIIASGIPMSYDSAGVKYDFVSAGMFEIEAKVKNQEVFIDKGKKMDVDFASYKEGSFSSYKINKETGKWSYKGIKEPKKNEGKFQRLKKFEDKNLVTFDIDYSTNEELKSFHDLNVKWLCIDPKEKGNPFTNDWVDKEKWYDISLSIVNKEEGIYLIKLSNSNKTAEFKVSPYQVGKSSMLALSNKVVNMNEAARLKKIEEERIQFEADITRSFEITSFGLYNCDKLSAAVAKGDLFVTNASFKVNADLLSTETNVYHFSGKDNLLFRVTKQWDKLFFDPREVNKVLVVLPGNYVAVSTPADFEKAKNEKEFVFSLKKRSQKIKSIAELDALLAMK